MAQKQRMSDKIISTYLIEGKIVLTLSKEINTTIIDDPQEIINIIVFHPVICIYI